MQTFNDVELCLFGEGKDLIQNNTEFVAKAKELMTQIAKDCNFTPRDFVCVGDVPANTPLSQKAVHLLEELGCMKKRLLSE